MRNADLSRSAMDSSMQVGQPCLQVSSIFFPRHPIHSRCSPLLQAVIAFPEQIDGYMVQQGGKPYFPVSLCCFSHTVQPAWPIFPARCPAWVRLFHVLLGQPPSLHSLRQRSPVFVRLLRRYYAAVRLPAAVHAGLICSRFLPPARRFSATGGNGVSRFSRMKFLCVRRVCDSAGPRGTRSIAPHVVAFRTRGRRPLPDLQISELDTLPTYTPIQRFECGLTTALAWLGAGLVR